MTNEDQRFELVIEAGTVSIIRADSDLARWHREMLASGHAEIYRYDHDIAYPVLITDDSVNLVFPNGDEAGGVWIGTDDSAVLEWAEVAFEAHRDRAVRLG